MAFRRPQRTIPVAAWGSASLLLLLTGCQAEVRPGTVETIGPAHVSISGVVEARPAGPPPTPVPMTAEQTALATAAGVTKGDGILTPGGNVNIYQLISFDVAEINRLTDLVNDGHPLPNSDVLAIYEGARIAKIGQTVRPLRAFAIAPARATDFPDEAAYYKTPTFLDQPVISAIVGLGPSGSYTPAQKRQAIQKGILRILRYFSVQELLAGEAKLAAGNVDPATGAPHNVEEAWAIYVGAEQSGKYPFSLANTALSREANFGRDDALDKPLREALARAQKAALAKDMPGFAQAKADYLSRMNAIFYLSTARYLHEPVKSVQAGNPQQAQAQLMEGSSYYMTIQPTVAKADAASDRTLTAFFQTPPAQLTAASRDQALEALNRAADALGLKAGDRVAASDFK
ncbi:MAG: hypothetical protein NTZ05_22990 [Chloroflexi bacterium]|nr:hypothetical protein [Chloroflexota bacterium]